MQAVLWSDYLCPWCYLGRDRTALLRELGVTVTALPYELHPEIPPEGRRVRPDGRLQPVFDRIEAECDELGIAFRRPEHMPNTRRALETAEVVRHRYPDAFAGLDQALFDAQFVLGDDIGDSAVIDRLVAASGADAADVRSVVDEGRATPAVDAAITAAHEQGVTGTPAWLVDDRLLIPGVQPRDTIRRWVERLRETAAGQRDTG